MNYITKAELEAYSGITLTDNGVALFNLLLPSMQEMIDNYCERSWNFSNPVIETFDAIQGGASPYPTDTFFVKYPSVTAINSITIGGQVWDLTYAYNYKTHIKLSINPQPILLVNPLGFQSVVISYNSDSAGALPSPVKLALIEWVARKMQTATDAGKEAAQVQTGTVSVRYKEDKVGGIPDFVRVVLDSYRLMPIDRF